MASEPKAKRTHARRSCDLCKVRKTRCELPDLDILPSSTPLPIDKSCHRCRVLSLPCVVDDSSRKTIRKDTSGSGSASGLGGMTPDKPAPKRRKRDSELLSGAGSNNNNHDDSSDTTAIALRMMQTFGTGNETLDQAASGHELDPSLRWSGPAFGAIPDSNIWTGQEGNTKYYMRQYELVTAMLSVAYGRIRTTPPKLAFGYDIDLDKFVDAGLRQRLEPGFAKLRISHSHLDTLPALFKLAVDRPSISMQLLLSTSLYLSSLGCPLAGETIRLRDTLSPYIYALRDSVMNQLPHLFCAVQALEMLAVHAPFGVLPLDTTTLSSVALARGTISTAKTILAEMNAIGLVRSMVRAGHLHAFNIPDVWTWLATCSMEAQYRLEDEVIRVPADFMEARQIAETFFEKDDMSFWLRGVRPGDDVEQLSRLSTCDEIVRLGIVLDFTTRTRDSLEAAFKDPTFDLVPAIDSMFKYTLKQMEKEDHRHEAILAMINSPLSAGYKRYRLHKRRSEEAKILVTGIRGILAVPFLHDSTSPDGGSGTPVMGSLLINRALQKAADPISIIPLLEDGTKALARAVWQWGRLRGEISEAVIADLPALLDNFLGGSYDVFPIVDAACFVVDCAKNLLEIQAWRLSVRPDHREIVEAAVSPEWIPSLRDGAIAMRRVAEFTIGSSGNMGLDSVLTGCANIVSSMDRVASDRSKSFKGNADAVKMESQPQTQTHTPGSIDQYLSGVQVGEGGHLPQDAQGGQASPSYGTGSSGQTQTQTGTQAQAQAQNGVVGSTIQAGSSTGNANTNENGSAQYPATSGPSSSGQVASVSQNSNLANHSLAQAQSYMPTSDRWMAGGASGSEEDAAHHMDRRTSSGPHGLGHVHVHGHGHGHGHGYEQGQAYPQGGIRASHDAAGVVGSSGSGGHGTYPPYIIDQILSETFSYAAYELPAGQHAPLPAPDLGEGVAEWQPESGSGSV